MLAGDRLYVGNVEGTMTVLRAGRRKQMMGEILMDAALYSPPALSGDALYLATAIRFNPYRLHRRRVKAIVCRDKPGGRGWSVVPRCIRPLDH